MKSSGKLILNKKAKEFYKFSGDISLFDDYQKIVDTAETINKKRDVLLHPERILKVSELFAYLIFPKIYNKILKKVNADLDLQGIVDATFEKFSKQEKKEFYSVYKDEFALGNIDFANIVTLKLINENPAYRKIDDLISDRTLKNETVYTKFFSEFEKKIQDYKFYFLDNKNPLQFLRDPFIKYPDDIYKQILFVIDNWKNILGNELDFLLKAIDYYKEETKFGLPGPGATSVYSFYDEEPEHFSEDKDWMPHLVMIAKSTYVWLNQLSKKYNRKIKKLSDIPEEELGLLSQRGFTGLWLIGVWERSKASKKIKELTGQTDIIASAYSLDDYEIASELGGEEAYQILKEKAKKYHIRLACDMVPNHTGLESRWMVEHPNYFMQLDYPPYPAYTFNGVNLSEKREIQVYLEDHYYDKTDAAVVFKLIDRNGRSRFIYHGNDGTSFPWNDTAQLDYTKEFVRQAVIDKIIEVAKKFPIIRFDAAMTLAKKHFQRLWFPMPGSGGAIPSRAQFGLTREQFDKLIPKEFWREVVDRIAKEAPDTLLLAEAFWMMEGYFVRTLGMHRVYNSAFMHMLKDEDNAKYRKSIFNVLEFNPQILKRFVNFMSNPDEETAINQFGDNDKYFGVCVLMATMPGLPMFAHGQIEGFKERYGMEYYKARWSETEKSYLVERHYREIFPLLRLRRFFSDVDRFFLFDFTSNNGGTNEDVFAYTNEYNSKLSLVIYHNKYGETAGYIKTARYPEKAGDDIFWKDHNVADVLHLKNDKNYFVIYKDTITGLEYVRNSEEVWESGFYFYLKAYEYHVFFNFREVKDDMEHSCQNLSEYLQGGGVADINHLLRKLKELPVIKSFNRAFSNDNLSKLISFTKLKSDEYTLFLDEYLKPEIRDFINIIETDKKSDELIKTIMSDLTDYILNSKNILDNNLLFNDKTEKLPEILAVYYMMRRIKRQETDLFENHYLWEELEKTIGYSDTKFVIKILSKLDEFMAFDKCYDFCKAIFEDDNAKRYLNVNIFENAFWFNKEKFEILFNLIFAVAEIDKLDIKKCNNDVKSAFQKSDYQVGKLLRNLE